VITDFLLEHAAVVPLALLVTVVLCAGIGRVLLHTGRRAWLWPMTALTAVPVVALTLTPTGTDTLQRCAVQFSLPTLGSVELLANVALLLPVVFFATLASGRAGWMLVAGSALSAVIEGLQALVPAIGRSCDTNDWAMNTVGVLTAAALGWALLTHDREA
jgi:hypothetical protein